MKNQSKTELKVGVTVTLALILLIWLISWAKNYSLSADRKALMVRFQNVSGLETGDQVTVNGVRMGWVDQIVEDKGTVVLRLSLDPGVELRKDAQFYLTMLDLMGGKKIDIAPGNSPDPIDFNAVQSGEFTADVAQLMAKAGALSADLPDVINEVKKSLQSLNAILGDAALQQNLKSSLANLAEVTDASRKLVAENQAAVKTLLTNAKDLSLEARDFLKKNKDGVSSSLQELESLLKKSNELVNKLSVFADETLGKQNAVGKLIYDEQTMNDIKETLRNVKDLTKTLNDQLTGSGVNVKADLDIF